MYRIYKCKICKYTGIVEISSTDMESSCALCYGDIFHSEGMMYSTSYEDAEQKLTELVALAQLHSGNSTISRGLGVKKRVLRIIEAVIDMNRGHPAKWHQVMSECSDAGIDLERASHFIDILKRDGILIEQEGGLIL